MTFGVTFGSTVFIGLMVFGFMHLTKSNENDRGEYIGFGFYENDHWHGGGAWGEADGWGEASGAWGEAGGEAIGKATGKGKGNPKGKGKNAGGNSGDLALGVALVGGFEEPPDPTINVNMPQTSLSRPIEGKPAPGKAKGKAGNEPKPEASEGALYWRVANAQACTWRPEVKDFKLFSDRGLTTALLKYDKLISSGYNPSQTEAKVGPQLAVDKSMSTAWRPQHAAAGGSGKDGYVPGEVWIGMKFATPTTVKGARAVGLGKGSGGGQSWNGGITLQSSNDGVNWTTVAMSSNGDTVTVDQA